MTARLAILAAVLLMLLAGCGNASAGQSPKAQMQATQRAYLAAMKTNDIGAACRLTADQRDCLGTFAAVKAAGIKPSDTLNGNEEHLIATMKVTVHGSHARTARGNEFLKRGGRWLIVLKGN